MKPKIVGDFCRRAACGNKVDDYTIMRQQNTLTTGLYRIQMLLQNPYFIY